jgi:Ca2+/Na+ antiporter
MLSSLVKLIKKIISKIIDLVKEIFKKLWPLLLIIAIVFFAPAIAGFLGSIGAPQFLVSAFTWVGSTVTPILTSGLSALWSGATSIASSGWSAFKAASMSTKLALVTGASALIAPEETAEFIGDAAEFVADTAVGIVGAIASGILSNPLILVGGALALWLLFRNKKQEVVIGGYNELQQ